MASSVSIHRFPNFFERASADERQLVKQLEPAIERTANALGASYAYVTKSKTGSYYPVTIDFRADGGKFVGRRTTRTVLLER